MKLLRSVVALTAFMLLMGTGWAQVVPTPSSDTTVNLKLPTYDWVVTPAELKIIIPLIRQGIMEQVIGVLNDLQAQIVKQNADADKAEADVKAKAEEEAKKKANEPTK